MGLFDSFKKKEVQQPKQMTVSDFQKELVQEAGLILNKAKLVTSPFVLTINEDGGIREGIIYGRLHNPAIQMYKQQPQLYLFLICGHLFGTGVYVANSQKRYGKGANAFTREEMLEIKNVFDHIDLYELGLNTLEVPVTSNDKSSIDAIIMAMISKAKTLCPNLINNNEYQTALMTVMYNVGVTVVAAFGKM